MDRWWGQLRACSERAGPTVIKLFQWASTRRDLFSSWFCDFFGVLHDRNPPHAWRHTQQRLAEAFGPDWEDWLQLEPEPVGVGCVAQVHRGVLRQSTSDTTGELVAVKVLHPHVHAVVARDLDLMRLGVGLIEALVPSLRWLAMGLALEEFSKLMNLQLDLRVEARNLERFHRDFRPRWYDAVSLRTLYGFLTLMLGEAVGPQGGNVTFPTPLAGWCTQSVMVETFIKGIPVSDVAKRGDASLRRAVSRAGVDVFVRMMFEKNFVHGDLHPGNILVYGLDTSNLQGNPKDTELHLGHGILLVLLDAGIVTELSPNDYRNFSDFFLALLKKDGPLIGRLILERSRYQQCADPEAFVAEMAKLADRVLESGLVLNRIDISALLKDALSVAMRHRVRLESNFTNVALSIMVPLAVFRDGKCYLLLTKKGTNFGLTGP